MVRKGERWANAQIAGENHILERVFLYVWKKKIHKTVSNGLESVFRCVFNPSATLTL